MSYQNPEKKVQTSIPAEQICKAIKSIPENLSNVTMAKYNDDFSFYVLETKASGLNLGAFLEISVSQESGYTNVHMLCRRKVNFIDQYWEYENCQNVMEDCMNLISKAVKGELKKQA